jgi:hypothetical protein
VACYDTATIRRTRLQTAYIHRDEVHALCRAVLYFPAFTVHAAMRLRRCPSLSRLSWNPRSSAASRADVHRPSLNTAPLGARRILTKIVTTQQSISTSIIPNCNPIGQEIRKLRVEIHLHPNGSKTVKGTNFHTTHASHKTFSHELLLKFTKIYEMVDTHTRSQTDGRKWSPHREFFFYFAKKPENQTQ